ncbi:hypothetical protein ABMA27_010044 [Loxostege sticticalis]|uniref:Peptidase S1 domain-containing protein n=1 Tax=Loxostege sticticalis TaxID=481309 RepID=A0ABR3H7C9_LOXSC
MFSKDCFLITSLHLRSSFHASDLTSSKLLICFSVLSDMDSQTHLCVFIVLSLFGQSLSLTPKLHVCDMSRADNLQEGNIGESENFPWLGILRVNLHEFDQVKVAVTGLVLVKERYAIANAQDIAKIPKPVFIEDSNAMFIPKRGEPWVTKLKDYMIHHEFEFFTYNTIALVELELEEKTIMPFKPVCWPGNYFNTTNLYALGYTDDNKRMEKTLYSLQYVKPSLCKDFYNRAGFSEPKSAPTYIQCGVATNNKKDCLWENGMAMVSNSSGKWTLIGFGVRGPGCSAPARFIDMFAYLPWVERATDLEQTNDLPDYQRKTAFNVGFRRKYTDSDNSEF